MKEKMCCVEIKFTLVKYFELGAKNKKEAKKEALKMGEQYKKALHQTVGIVTKIETGTVMID